MMRMLRLTVVMMALLACARAHAANCPISAGASQSSIQTALSSCGSGNTAVFAAGSYTFSSSVSWPCGVSISGPVVAYPGPYTATINFSFAGAWAFDYPACSVSGVSFKYMNVVGSRPSGGGGGAIYLATGGGAAPLIEYNYFHGVQSDINGDCCAGGEIYADGSDVTLSQYNAGQSTWSNLNILWNLFGATGDCSNLMNAFSYNGNHYDSAGGFCSAVNLHTSTRNLTIENNNTIYLEQGIKFQEPSSGQGTTGPQYWHSNTNVLYNDFAGIHRIVIEAQDTPNPTMNFNYNDVHGQVDPGYGSWMFSLPQYDGGGATYTNQNTNSNDNVFVGDVPPGSGGGYIPAAVEFWGTGQSNYNLEQGYLACGASFGYGNSPWQLENNLIQLYSSTFSGFICNEEHQTTNPNPTQSANVTSNTPVAQTSVAPTMSPASGSFSGSQTVTFTNPGANRDANTGIWYTTDGSTPVPGSAHYIQGGGTISVTTTTTVKAVGMWGALNQPTSYPSGLGYVPSAVVSATYTSGGGGGSPTLTGGYQGNSGSVNTLAVGSAAIQQVADGTYSDSVTRTLPDAYGNTAVWSSSNTSILNVSSTGLVSCVGIGTASSKVVSSPGGVVFNGWTWTCTAPPTLLSVTLAATGGVTSINYQATNQILATCHYSDGSTTSCNTADSHGNGVSSWASSNTAYVGLSGTGVATGVAVGSSNLTSVVAGITSSPALTLAVTSSNTLVSAYLSGASSCIPAATIQFAARCHYTTGADQDCTVTDIYGDAVTAWNSSTPSLVSIANVGSATPGLATCVAVGSATITATVDNTVTSSATTVTVSSPSVTLTGVSLATTGGVTALLVGSTNQLKATCTYSDGSNDICTTTDVHGSQANTWASTAPGHASVNATSGLATGVAPGATTFTAKAGTLTSPAIPLSVMAIPSGVYTITITGPVTITGTVQF
jgi:Chitobiase/beta-hexosaminidase C-terminal domain